MALKIVFTFLSTIILYIYLHNPILGVINTGTTKVLYLLLFLCLSSIGLKIIKKNVRLLQILLLIVLFCILRSIVGGDPSFVRSSIIAVIELFFLPLSIVVLFDKWHLNFNKLLLLVCAVSAIISLIGLLSPSFNQLCKVIFPNPAANNDIWVYRGYGISEGLTFAYGVILGTIIAMSFKFINNYKWFYLILPIAVLSILINARTGMLIVLCGFCLFILLHFKKGLKLSLLIMIVIAIMQVIDIDINFQNDYTLVYINKFFYELSDILLGTQLGEGTTVDVLNTMWIYPNSFVEWILGTGKSVFYGVEHSDIGFVLQLNYGGLLYILLLFLFLIECLKKMQKDGYLFLLFTAIFLITNLKGQFLLNTGISRLMLYVIMSITIIEIRKTNNYLQSKR